MSDIKVVNTNTLVSQESIQFIRSQIIELALYESRPNTRMYVFFSGQDVTEFCSTGLNEIGTPIITNSVGQVVIKFSVPAQRFNTGNHELLVSDSTSFASINVVGSVYGSAKGIFSANGTMEIFQPKQTTITTVERVVPIIVCDPLAQSFFTTNVTGGMFLTSIEVFFQTKDTSIPVRCEIRPMVNGYPSSLDPSTPTLISVVNPANVNISNDASVPTKFSFNPPLYLKENSDYCFVLRSNSNGYNVFTSRMGENSIEDGLKIFSQPYVGSLFKSENAITWTAEQFEDIKFVINKAKFDTTTTGVMEFGVKVPHLAAFGYQFKTVAGSNIVTYTHAQEHGLESGSKLNVVTRTDSLYTGATFNGIPFIEFNNSQTVISVVDRNTVTFSVATAATSSGVLETSNILAEVIVLSSGINYQDGDTITFTGGGGTGATASLVIVGGSIKEVLITNQGSGYTTKPNYSITTTAGTGAKIATSVTPTFSTAVNKPMNGFIPKINIFNHGNSTNRNTLTTTIGNYDSGTLNTYSAGKVIEFTQNQPYPNISQNSLVASSFNESAHMGGYSSSKVTIEFNTPNPNVSPILDMKNKPVLDVYSNIVNNQPEETIGALVSSGSLVSITVTGTGSGYTANPVVNISAPNLEDGVQATATVSRTGSSLNVFTITQAGSGYTSTPIITITRDISDTTGIGGAGQALLTPFNTELLPKGGGAKARYITKKTGIQIISTGVRLYCVLSSVSGSSVEWYIRTSLSGSGVNHESQQWQQIICNVERNKSSFVGEMFEYEFNLDNISEFDNYDLKCVMRAKDPTKAPIINSYRLIVLA